MCRAAAATYWQAGIDGIYLWNNHLIEWAANANYDRTPWKEVADPNKISKLNKHYLLDYDPIVIRPRYGEFGRITKSIIIRWCRLWKDHSCTSPLY